MELIIPFRKSDFTHEGNHVDSGMFITELQLVWENHFHNVFNPYFANVIEGHPLAMIRLTRYFEQNMASGYDFGMEMIDGNIDIETHLEMESFSVTETVYAIGSRIKFDAEGDGEPVLLLKNYKLKEDILVFKYIPDDDEEVERVAVNDPAGVNVAPC